MSFAVAFLTLLMFIKIPEAPRSTGGGRESFLKSCMAGIKFLLDHSALLRISLFFSVINFLAKIGGDGMMSAFVLGRTGGDQKALGMVEAAVALGILTGSTLVTLTKPAKNKVNVIFICCTLTFWGNVWVSLSTSLPFWIVVEFVSYVPVAILGACLTAIMRAHVPIEMQGRVFSAKDTLQNCMIPLGLFLGGVLADHVAEPFMAVPSPAQRALGFIFGTGKGSGIAVIFFIVGILGSVISIVAIKRAGANIVIAEPEKDCNPLTLVYCSFGTSKLVAT